MIVGLTPHAFHAPHMEVASETLRATPSVAALYLPRPKWMSPVSLAHGHSTNYKSIAAEAPKRNQMDCDELERPTLFERGTNLDPFELISRAPGTKPGYFGIPSLHSSLVVRPGLWYNLFVSNSDSESGSVGDSTHHGPAQLCCNHAVGVTRGNGRDMGAAMVTARF